MKKSIFLIFLCIGLLCGCGAQEKGVCYAAVERSDFQNQVKPGTLMEIDTALLYLAYDARVYTSSHMWTFEQSDLADVLGDALGTAYCNSLYWFDSTDGLPTVSKEATIYAVRGYEPDFRVCALEENTIGGDTYHVVTFFDCLNGITLRKGEDLFAKKLHLRADQCKDASAPTLESFVAALNAGTFVQDDPTLGNPACKLTFTDAYGIPTVLEVFEGYVRLKQLGVEAMVVQVDAQECKAILAEVS